MSALPVAAQPVRLLPDVHKAAHATPAEILERWFSSLSPATARGYATSFRAFAAYATGKQLENAADATARIVLDGPRARARNLIVGFRDHLTRLDKAPATVACRVAALCSAIKALHDAGACEWTVERVAPKVEQRHDRSGPKRDDVIRLITSIESDESPAGARDAAIIRLLHDCGLRRGEVVGLRPCDLKLDSEDRPTLMVLRKGHVERKPVAIGHKATQALRRWLGVRGEIGARSPIFVAVGRGNGGQSCALSGDGVRVMLKRRARIAGVIANVRPHGLRHSGCTEVARRGSLTELMEYGQWRSLSAARRYLDADQSERRRALALAEA